MPIALIAMVVFKRNMAEAMLVGFLSTLLFAGADALSMLYPASRALSRTKFSSQPQRSYS